VNLLNQLLVNAVIFLVGLAFFGLTAELGIDLGLATDTARLLGLGALVAYFLAIAILVRRRRRSAPPGGIQ
jgi:type VI protein secretion system component VasK